VRGGLDGLTKGGAIVDDKLVVDLHAFKRSAVGVLSVVMLSIGYVTIFFLAQQLELKDPYNDEGDSDEQ